MARTQDTETLSNLKLPEHYNRTNVDGIYVAHLADALKAGVTLPPIRVERETLEVVDGVHRWHAHRKMYGPDYQIAVMRLSFNNAEEKFLAGLRENAHHGRALAPLDMKHCIELAERLAFDLERVQVALAISPERFTRYAAEFAHTESGQKVILPRSMRHLAGQIVPDASMQTIRSADGSTLRAHARQLIRALSRGLVDWVDEDTVATLHELHEMLARVLPAKQGAA